MIVRKLTMTSSDALGTLAQTLTSYMPGLPPSSTGTSTLKWAPWVSTTIGV
jgi:hypothetical protein